MIGTVEETIVYLLKQDRNKLYKTEECRPKRSLNANNYFWHLCNVLANILKMDKEEVHLILLQKYGQSEMVSVLATINVDGFFKYYTEAGQSTLNGKEFKHYKVYKGTSEMNSKEMSLLIEGTVEECKIQGIETKSQAEIDSLLERWNK